jgi:hypothetical protein
MYIPPPARLIILYSALENISRRTAVIHAIFILYGEWDINLQISIVRGERAEMKGSALCGEFHVRPCRQLGKPGTKNILFQTT